MSSYLSSDFHKLEWMVTLNRFNCLTAWNIPILIRVCTVHFMMSKEPSRHVDSEYPDQSQLDLRLHRAHRSLQLHLFKATIHSGDMGIAIDRWLLIPILLNESSAESSCISFLHYFHAAISNHLSEKPKICLVGYGRLTQV